MNSLAGKTIALPETRELDKLAGILEEAGATTLRCPLVAILDAPDPSAVDAWLAVLAAGGFDDLIFLTGEGLRRMLARAERTGQHAHVLAALGRVRKITRGPKPARALHEVGLTTDLAATTPTSQGVMDTLGSHDLQGRRIGLQLYGSEPNQPLVRFLTAAGASVHVVAPYIYAPASDEDRVLALITRLAAGGIDAIAFTSASQVDRLWGVAGTKSAEATLQAGLRKTKVAAIGPIVVEALQGHGITADIVPEQPFIMKRLTSAIAAALVPR